MLSPKPGHDIFLQKELAAGFVQSARGIADTEKKQTLGTELSAMCKAGSARLLVLQELQPSLAPAAPIMHEMCSKIFGWQILEDRGVIPPQLPSRGTPCPREALWLMLAEGQQQGRQ